MKDSESQRRSKSDEEQKRINIALRGGKNVKQKEEELGTLGDTTDQAGTTDGQQGRQYGADQELKSDEAKKGGRKGGRIDH